MENQQTTSVAEARAFFRKNYSYIAIDQLSDREIQNHLNQRWVKERPLESQMDLLRDWIISQDMADVVE